MAAVLAAGAGMLLACAPGPRATALAPSPGPDPVQEYLAGRNVVFAHLALVRREGDRLAPGTMLGTIEPMPMIQSERHQAELQTAQGLYVRGRFLDAALLLEPAVRDEPDNPFLLEVRARALFRVDSLRPASRETYRHLVAVLNRRVAQAPEDVVVDLWFVDAYWKLALLCLDSEDYQGALGGLVKVAMVSPSQYPAAREQLYAYFAETFFHLGQRDAANYYVRRTLEQNPRNTYVLEFGTLR